MTDYLSSMASLAKPVLTVEPSLNICSSRDKFGTTVVSTAGKTQQSPLLGQRVGRPNKVVKGAGELRGPGRPTRANLPDSDSDADEVEGGVAQSSATLLASPKNLQKRKGDSSLLPSPRCWDITTEYTNSNGNFGLLEALETGRSNINKALDEISDAGTRRALRSVMDEELGKVSVAISKELAEKAILASELSLRSS